MCELLHLSDTQKSKLDPVLFLTNFTVGMESVYLVFILVCLKQFIVQNVWHGASEFIN